MFKSAYPAGFQTIRNNAATTPDLLSSTRRETSLSLCEKFLSAAASDGVPVLVGLERECLRLAPLTHKYMQADVVSGDLRSSENQLAGLLLIDCGSKLQRQFSAKSEQLLACGKLTITLVPSL